MLRGILLGAAAFAAVVILERQLGTVFQDMRRYDRLRAMSGDASLLTEGAKLVRDFALRRSDRKPDSASDDGAKVEQGQSENRAQAGGGSSLLGAALSDAVRYNAMRSM